MLKGLVRTVMLLEDKSTCDGNIEEKMEDILVELPASSPTAVVPSLDLLYLHRPCVGCSS